MDPLVEPKQLARWLAFNARGKLGFQTLVGIDDLCLFCKCDLHAGLTAHPLLYENATPWWICIECVAGAFAYLFGGETRG